MPGIVSGGGLGLFNTSLHILGAQGGIGSPAHGRANELVYVNAANGNLVLRRLDDVLAGTGPDLNLHRTYNSRGTVDGDNNDGWRIGVYKKVALTSGTLNQSGSTVTRTDGDGTDTIYSYDGTKYVTTDGDGAHDTLTYSSSTWTWRDGSTQRTETYDSNGRITNADDLDGNTLTFVYTGTLITRVDNENGEKTHLTYDGSNLTQISVEIDNGAGGTTTISRTTYQYTSNKLTQVTVDLTPQNTGDSSTYVTTYTYHSASNRVATITQSDGSSLTIAYESDGSGGYRVESITDGLGRTTEFNYSAGYMDQVDPLGKTTRFRYNTDAGPRYGRLETIESPAVGGVTIDTEFSYDDVNGTNDVIKVTRKPHEGSAITEVSYQYDSNGNQTLSRDLAGNTITRTYGSSNQLLSETAYLVADPDGAGSSQPGTPLATRFVYDGELHLRFAISPEGRVTEHRYSTAGNRTSTIQYTADNYTTAGTPTETNMTTWLSGVTKSKSIRVDTAYDFRGLVSSVTTYASVDSGGDGVANGTQAVTEYVYDQAGQLLKTIGARGTATTGAPNDHVTTFAYDGLGRLLSTAAVLGTDGLSLPGTSGSYASTPDSAEASITGDIDIRVKAALDDWTPGADQTLVSKESASNASYWLRVDGTTGKLSLQWSADGSAVVGKTSTVAVGAADGSAVWVRAVLDVDNGASGHDVKFYTSADGNTWVQLGSTVTTSGSTSIYDGTAAVLVGARSGGSTDPLDGKIYVAEIRNGIGGAVAVTFDAADADSSGVTSFVSTTGETWTVSGSAAIDAKVETTVRTYDDAGNTTETSIANVGASQLLVTTSVYNDAGELVSVQESDGSQTLAETEYFYDANGRLRRTEDPTGVKTHILYDDAGRKVAAIDGDGSLTEFVYNANGQVIRSIRYANAVTSGNLASLESSGVPTTVGLSSIRPAGSALDRHVWSVYDAAGREVYTIEALGGEFLNLTGASGSYASAPDSPANSVTGDIDLRVRVSLDDWTPSSDSALLAKENAASDRSYYFYVAADGKLHLGWTADGSTGIDKASTVTTGFVNGSVHWVRATLDVDNGSSGNDVRFYTSEDGVTWTQLGTTVTTAGTTSLHNGTTALELGSRAGGTQSRATGKIYEAQLLNGIHGTLAAKFDPAADSGSSSVASFTSSTSEVWTMNGEAAIDARGTVTFKEYDGTGKLIRSTAYANSIVIPSAPALSSVASGITTNTTEDRVARHFYDGDSRLRATIDPAGYVVEYLYDAAGQLVKTVAYATVSSSPSGTTLDAVRPAASADDIHSHRRYNARGQLVREIDAEGYLTETTYDAAGNVAQVNRYADSVYSRGLNLPGTSGSYASALDSPQNSVTGDLDVRVRVSLNDWTPSGDAALLAKDDAASNRSYYFYVATDGKLHLGWTANGSADIDKASTVATSFVDGSVHWVRATLDVDNGASGNDVKFYTSDDGVTWDALGATVTTSGTTSVYNGTAPLELGSRAGGTQNRATGGIYAAQLRNGIDGAVVATFSPGLDAPSTSASTFTSSTNEVWTVNGSATLNTVNAAGARVSTFTYDAFNRLSSETNAEGTKTRYMYDDVGNHVKTARAASTTEVRVLNAQYDRQGRLTGELTGVGSALLTGNPTNDAAVWAQYGVYHAYDAAGRRTHTIDANGNKTRFYYDVDGRLAYTVNALGEVAQSKYNALGQLAETVRYGTRIGSGTLATLTTGGLVNSTLTNAVLAIVNGAIDSRAITTYHKNGAVSTVTETAEGKALSLPGTSGSYASTSDHAANSITGDIDLRVKVSLDDWTPAGDSTLVAKDNAASDRSYLFYVSTGGNLKLSWTADGSTNNDKASTVATGFANGSAHWVRATLDVNNGSSGHDVKFYVSEDGINWTQLGSTVTTSGATSIHDGARPLEIGARSNGTQTRAAGKFYYAEVRNGIDGAVAVRFDPATNAPYAGVPTFTSSTGEAWTINGSATIEDSSHTTTHAYNAFGELTGRSEQIGGGQTLDHTYVYDKRGLLAQTIWDPNGINSEVETEYDAFGRAVSVTDANGNEREYTYDKLGRTVVIEDPQDHTRETTYDAFARVLTTTDALGNTTSYTYDDAARKVTISAPEGITTSTQRTRHGEVWKITDGSGNTTNYNYDKNGNLTSVVTPAGTTSHSYDEANLLIETTDGNGTKTAFAYDAANRVLTRTVDPNPAGQSSHLALVTTYEYDPKGQAVKVTDARGTITQTRFDLKGQVTEVIVDPTEFNSNGLNLKTTYAYDGRGKTLTVVQGASTSGARRTDYVYDKLGRLTSETADPQGLNIKTTYAYDKNNNVVTRHHGITATDTVGVITRYAYDTNDRLVYTVDALGGVIEKLYDANGLVTKTIAYGTPISLSGLAEAPALSAVQSLIDADSAGDRVTLNVYDRAGRLVYAIDALGYVKYTQYDGAGRVIHAVQYATAIAASDDMTPGEVDEEISESSADQQNDFTYDAAGRLFESRDAEGNYESFGYDAVGNRTSFTNKRGATWTYTYDAANRVITELSPAVDVTTVTESAGIFTSVTESQRIETRITYNEVGDLLSRTEAYGLSEERTTSYTYDRLGRQIRTDFPEVGVYDAEEDDLTTNGTDGTVTRAETTVTPTVIVTYDILGNAVVNQDAGGNYSYKVYDLLGRVEYDIDAAGYVTEHGYDALGNKTAVTRYATALNFAAVGNYGVHADGAAFTAAEVAGRLTPEVSASSTTDKITLNNHGLANGTAVTFGGTTMPGGLTGSTVYYVRDATTNDFKVAATVGGAAIDLTSTGANVTVKTSSPDRSITTQYDALGRAMQITEPAVDNYDPGATDGAPQLFTIGRTTKNTHNAFGQIVKTSVLRNPGADVALGGTGANADIWADTYFYYDRRGNRIAQIDALGYITRWEYDETGDVTRQIEYATALTPASWSEATDIAELSISTNSPQQADPNPDIGYDREVVYTYDRKNQKIAETRVNVESTRDTASMQLPGTTGSYASTPDSAAISVTGDIDIRVMASLTDWTPSEVQELVAKFTATGDQRSYDVAVDTAGKLRFRYTTNGSTIVTKTSTVAPAVANGGVLWVRVTLDVNDGADGNITRFYTSSDGQTWTLLGDPITTGGTTSIYDGTGVLELGAQNVGALNPAAGRIYFAEIRSGIGIDGTVVAVFDPTSDAVSSSADGFTSATGETWTLHGSATTDVAAIRDGTASGTPVLTTTIGNVTTTYGYDAVGNLTRTTVAGGASTYTYYDALGRAIATAEPSRVSDPSGGVVVMPPVSGTTAYFDVGSVTSAVGGSDEYGYTWSGTSSVNLRWSSLEGYGAGTVRVRIDYTTTTAAGGSGATTYREQVFSANASYSGVSFQWSEGSSTSYNGGIYSVSQVRVWKTVNGQEIQVHDRTSDYTERRVVFAKTHPADTDVTFKYREKGSTGSWSTATLQNDGAYYSFAVGSLAASQYDYELYYQRAGESSEYAKGTGTFNVWSENATGSANAVALSEPDMVPVGSSVQGASYYSDEYGSGWTGTNSVSVSWPSLENWGGGNVKVRIDYYKQYSTGAQGTSAYVEQTFTDSVSSLRGVTVAWDGTASGAYGGIHSISRIQVHKQVNGTWVLARDTQSPVERVILQGNTTGVTSVTVGGNSRTVTELGGGFSVIDISGLARGTYTYTLGSQSGSFEVKASATSGTAGVQEIGAPGARQLTVHNVATTESSVVLKYRRSGDNGGYLSKTFGVESNAWRASYDDISYGSYDYIIYVNGSAGPSGTMYIRRGGQSIPYVTINGNATTTLTPLTVRELDAHGNAVRTVRYAKGALSDISESSYSVASADVVNDRVTYAFYDSHGHAIRTLDVSGMGLTLPGTSGSYVSTPDSAALDITGDIDIRLKMSMTDWTPSSAQSPIGKTTTSSTRSYRIDVLTDGKLQLRWSADGTNELSATSTVAAGVADGATKWVRVVMDVNNGASGRNVMFYLSDDGQAWTQLGTTVTQSGTTSIYSSGSDLKIGAVMTGTTQMLSGKVYYAEIRNGIAGTVAARFDPASDAGAATESSFMSSTGEDWTLHGSAALIPLGASTYASYDKLGHVAKEWKPVLSGDGVADNSVRVFQYDNLGRQTATVEPSYELNRSLQASGATQSLEARTLTFSTAASQSWYSDEYGSSWTGSNQINIGWNAMSGWGNGDVMVGLDYTKKATGGAGPTAYREVTLTSSAGNTGTTMSWSDPSGGTYAGVHSIQRVRVWKKDVSGNWALVHDRTASASNYGQSVVWTSAVASSGYGGQLRYKLSGQSTWTTATSYGFGTKAVADITGLSNNTYQYGALDYRPGATRPFAEARGTFTVTGAASGSISGDSGVPSSWDPALNPAEYVTTQAQYNAFGEITARGVNGNQGIFEYDQAGRLWRTNGDDGVARIYYLDLNGKVTAEFRNQASDLRMSSITSPVDSDFVTVVDNAPVSFLAGTMRTDIHLDALGRVTKRVEPMFATDAVFPPSAYTYSTLTFGIGSSMSWYSDEYGSSWTGSNQVNVAWNAMGAWGLGEVKIGVDYKNYTQSMTMGQAVYRDIIVNSGTGNAGATMSWTDTSSGTYGGVHSIQRVRVWKKDLAGNWQLVHDRTASASNYARTLVWQSPTDLTASVEFKHRNPGSGSWTTVTPYNFGSYMQVSLPALSGNAAYPYEINYTRAGESEPYAQATGNLVQPLDSSGTTLTFSTAASQSWYSDEYGSYWTGSNQINVGWNAMSGWGSGDVKVGVDYKNYTQSMTMGQAAYREVTVNSSTGNTGVTMSWSDSTGGTYAGVHSIQRVRVWKKDSAGNWQLIHDRTAGASNYGRVFNWTAPASGTTVQFKYKQNGTGTWSTLSTLNMGTQLLADIRGLSGSLTYDYEVVYTPSGGGEYTQATGTFTTGSGAPELVMQTATSNPGSTPPVTPTVTQTFDRWGSALTVSDARNEDWVTQYRYDQQGLLVQETKPEIDVWADTVTSGAVSSLETPTTLNYYDRLGRVIGVRDANGHTRSARYDAVGQLAAEYRPDGGVVKYQYNAFGDRIRVTDANGNVTQSTFDRLGRLVREQRPIGWSEYAYDALGNRIAERTAIDSTNSAVSQYWYDTRGKLIRSRLPLDPGETAAQVKETHSYYDTGGRKAREVNANGDVQTWTYDAFGRVLTHTDLGGVTYTSVYNNYLGLLTAQSSNRSGTNQAQNLQFSYYENGQLKRITDVTRNAETYYEYDAAGNRVRERFIMSGTTHQDNRLSYDRVGRVARVQNYYYDLVYGYDAVGNRRYAGTTYYDQSTNAQTFTSWYQYDAMNRITLSQGVMRSNAVQTVNASTGTPVTNIQKVVIGFDSSGNRVATAHATEFITITAPQGVALAYDAAGNRATATSWQSGSQVTESYTYDANNRLLTTNRSGSLTSSRAYDWASRVTETISYSSPGTINERKTNLYNYKGWLVLQETFNGSTGTTLKQQADYVDDNLGIGASGGNDTGNGYDNLGNLLQYKVKVIPGTTYTNTYAYTYLKYDTYKESVVSGTSTYYSAGSTTSSYDANGNVTQVTESFATSKNRSFVVNAMGHALSKTENGNTQRYFYANDKPIGSSGALAPADFDYNYTPVSDKYPAMTPGSYTVSSGDTLRNIALAALGDAALWFLIADANGIGSDSDLVVGKNLVIPNQVTNLHNSYQTFKPYSASAMIGDTTPTLPDPPPPPPVYVGGGGGGGGCGGIGQILMIIVTIVVAIYVPQALELAVGSLQAAVVGAAAGNIAGQVVGNITGVQNGFDFAGLAVSVLSAGLTHGISSALKLNSVAPGFNPQTAAKAAIGSVVNQGLNIIVGRQDKFDWKGVAAAAIAAPLAAGISNVVSGSANFDGSRIPSVDPNNIDFGPRFAGNLAGGAGALVVRQIVYGGGRMNVASVAADAFGNALGFALMPGGGSGQAPLLSEARAEAAGGNADFSLETPDYSLVSKGMSVRFNANAATGYTADDVNASIAGPALTADDLRSEAIARLGYDPYLDEEGAGVRLGRFDEPVNDTRNALFDKQSRDIARANDQADLMAAKRSMGAQASSKANFLQTVADNLRQTAGGGSGFGGNVGQSGNLSNGQLLIQDIGQRSADLLRGGLDTLKSFVYEPIAMAGDTTRAIWGGITGDPNVQFYSSWGQAVQNQGARPIDFAVNVVTAPYRVGYDGATAAINGDAKGVGAAITEGGLFFIGGKRMIAEVAPEPGATIGISFRRIEGALDHPSGKAYDLPAKFAGDFANAQPMVLDAGTKIYRVVGGTARDNGPYWSLERPVGSEAQWRGGNSMVKQWGNEGSHYVEFIVPKGGLPVWRGSAAAQKLGGTSNGIGWIQPGGSTQLFVPTSRTLMPPNMSRIPTPWTN